MRDSKGRFCRKDTDTPNLPVQEEIGYAPGFDFVESNPPHQVVKAYRVTDYTEGGAPVCYPFANDPDRPLYLYSFSEAKTKAYEETLELELYEYGRLAKDLCLLREHQELEFKKPEGLTEPKFKVGEAVYAVMLLTGINMHLTSCKGIIIGCMYEYEESYGSSGMVLGWNYQIYHQRRATEEDRYYNSTPGEILQEYEWVPEASLFRSQEDALKLFRADVTLLHIAYDTINKKLEELKPEDLKPK